MKIKIIKVIKVQGSTLKSNWRSPMQVIYIDGSKDLYIDKLPENGGTPWTKYKGKLITNVYTTFSTGYNWLQTKDTPIVINKKHTDESNNHKELYIIKEIHKAFGEKKFKKKEVNQLANYIFLFLINNYKEHWEVNEYISANDLWDEFDKLRSKNNHGYKNKVLGIEPRFFAVVCKVLDIDADDGKSLIDWKKY